MDKLTTALLTFRDIFLEDAVANSYYEVNDGECMCFADEFVNMYGEQFNNEILVYENLEFLLHDEDDDWIEAYDRALLTRLFPRIQPLEGLTWDDMDQLTGMHVFLYYQGYFYDIECPEGVTNFFELPLYRRHGDIIRTQKQKKNDL